MAHSPTPWTLTGSLQLETYIADATGRKILHVDDSREENIALILTAVNSYKKLYPDEDCVCFKALADAGVMGGLHMATCPAMIRLKAEIEASNQAGPDSGGKS